VHFSALCFLLFWFNGVVEVALDDDSVWQLAALSTNYY
jgi:hypothetical protein